MTIWAIADLHASRPDPETGLPTKPMDVFGPQWTDHMSRLESSWERMVRRDDTVLVVGDIDWAINLQDASFTLQRLERWNGSKILIRGNHDYWWPSKASNQVRRSLPSSIRLVHNDSVVVENVNICGCKGSPVPGGIDWTPDNEKLLNRELNRLRLSLESARTDLDTLAGIHYPPFYGAAGTSPFRDLLEEYRVRCCLYGHLHGDASRSGPNGIVGSVDYRLVAGDYVNFEPVPVWDGSAPVNRSG